MNWIKFSFLLLIISSCNNKSIQKIKFNTFDYTQNKKVLYQAFIPKGSSFYGVSGDGKDEYQYWYPDSSVIYITRDDNISNLNYDNLRNNPHDYNHRMLSDSISISGIQTNDKYWKDMKTKHISIGYANVAKNKKKLFEEAIYSLTKVKYY